MDLTELIELLEDANINTTDVEERDGQLYLKDGTIRFEFRTVESLRQQPRKERYIIYHGVIVRVMKILRYEDEDTVQISFRHCDIGTSLIKKRNDFIAVPLEVPYEIDIPH